MTASPTGAPPSGTWRGTPMGNFNSSDHPRDAAGKFSRKATVADPDRLAGLAGQAASFTRTVTVERTIHVPETGHDIGVPAGLEPVDDESIFVGDGGRGHGWTRVAWVVDDPDTSDPVVDDEGAECWDLRRGSSHAAGFESAWWNIADYAESRGVDPARVFPIRRSDTPGGTAWEVIDPDTLTDTTGAPIDPADVGGWADELYVVPADVDPDARADHAAGVMVERTAWGHGRCCGVASVDIAPDGRPDGDIDVVGGWLDTGRDGDETAQDYARSMAGRPMGYQEYR